MEFSKQKLSQQDLTQNQINGGFSQDESAAQIIQLNHNQSGSPISDEADAANGVASGSELLEMIVDSTGLPSGVIGHELDQMLSQAGQDPKTLTLDDLRAVMLSYLESTLGSLPEEEFQDSEEALK